MIARKQIEAVQGGFANDGREVAPLMRSCERLFETAQLIRPVFPGDMLRQRAELVSIRVTVVQSLHDLDTPPATLPDLSVGRPNVRLEGYGQVGGALILVLRNTTGRA